MLGSLKPMCSSELRSVCHLLAWINYYRYALFARIALMPTTSSTDRINWLNLVAIPGIGPSIFKEIRSKAKTSEVVDYSDQDLKRLDFNRRLRSLLQDKSCRELARHRAEKAMLWADVPGHHLVFIDDPEYPELLRHIADPPAFLFVDGDISVLSQNQIAMVGTRKASPSGYDAAKIFAYDLVKQEYVVTSGLAYGVDAASHQGALQGGGKTIAVLGSGINVIYPSAHADLAAQIRQNGAVISEFFPDVEPQKTFFPRRNRLISGLSMGVVVVEAAKKSGSLITAKLALEQGREVFALPGSIFNAQSQGCHELIKQGANLVESVDDILQALNGWLRKRPFEDLDKPVEQSESSKLVANKPVVTTPLEIDSSGLSGAPVYHIDAPLQNASTPKQLSFSEAVFDISEPEERLLESFGEHEGDLGACNRESYDMEQRVLASLDHSPASIDTLVQRSGLQSRHILVALLNLEIKGSITHHAGGYCLLKLTTPS